MGEVIRRQFLFALIGLSCGSQRPDFAWTGTRSRRKNAAALDEQKETGVEACRIPGAMVGSNFERVGTGWIELMEWRAGRGWRQRQETEDRVHAGRRDLEATEAFSLLISRGDQ